MDDVTLELLVSLLSQWSDCVLPMLQLLKSKASTRVTLSQKKRQGRSARTRQRGLECR